ncbi:MAG TPA: zinc-dependent alcohol dehydrogenase family protein [Acidimicrobiales bacterium]|nr:zinc-dependent alcohol dehydrogenase family protein [Acidimicrobiales bacterium]
MRAAVLVHQGQPLELVDRPEPVPGADDVLIRVEACAVCRTDLHLRDHEIDAHGLPRVLGHQIVGTVAGRGAAVTSVEVGARVGVPWLAWTDRSCRYCTTGRENLCPDARFTGRDVDGGFAELAVADARYCLPLPSGADAIETAPLLCGGLIGYRALRLTGEHVARLGLYGFGSAAHLICQVAVHQGMEVFAFVRRGDDAAAALARSVGAAWAGPSDGPSPAPLDAAIIFASAGVLVTQALRALAPGGSVVCAGIHMSDIPGFSYDDLYEERVIRSVANLTRDDGHALLAEVARTPVVSHVTTYPLEQAERALADLRAGAFVGSAVLQVG